MRAWLVLIAVVLVSPATAWAKPKVAVAPLADDEDNKVGLAVARAAEDDAREVIGPKETGRAMEKLELAGELGKKDVKKLRGKLEVDVVVQGRVEGSGKQKTVALKVSGKGVKTASFSIKYKAVSFRDDARDELHKRLAPDRGDDDDEEGEAKKPAKRVADDDEERGKVRKKKRRRKGGGDDDGPERHAITQVAVRVDAGPVASRRTLKYDATGAMQPRRLGTFEGSGRIEAEVYPGAIDTLEGVAASLGVFGDFEKTVGLSIKIPGTTSVVPIDMGRFSIGARYRIVTGTSTIALGVAYERSHYIADRSGLQAPRNFDAPDVDYAAIAPGVLARFAVAPKAAVFVGADVKLIMAAGAVTTKDYYGYADTIAFGGCGGVDFNLDTNYGLRFTAELDQIGLKFKGNDYSMLRGVTGATDRTIAFTAAFAVTY